MKLRDVWPVIFGVLLIHGIGGADGAPLTPADLATTYELAVSISKLPLAAPPTVNTLPHIRLMQLAKECCGIVAPSLKALALDGQIFLDDALDMSDAQNEAILLHELIHYLQFMKSGPAKDCAEWKDREITAYHYQNMVLYKAGHQLVMMPTMNCK